jgi:hypothetical protein
MAAYETTVEVTVKVLFTGTEEQFNGLTKQALNAEAIDTVKALLPGILVNDPTFDIDEGPSFDERFFSDNELAQASDPAKVWCKAPTAVLTASLPEQEEVS